jgi:hypothetical protein
MIAVLVLAFARGQDPSVDLSGYDAACGVRISRRGDALRAEWNADGLPCAATFRLARNRPLLESLELKGAPVARGLQPVWLVTTGARIDRPNERYIFFDKPATGKNGPVKTHVSELDPVSVRIESSGRRATISLTRLSAGPFSGTLEVHLYDGSPLLHLEAAMGQPEARVAYIYDAVLDGEVATLAWKDNTNDAFVRTPPEGAPRPVGVRHRTIMAESDAGTLAVFPPPHAFFFPRDHTDNFRFAQAGKGRFGLRQDPDQKNAFVPWFDAPPGRTQSMGVFLLLSAAKAEETLARVLRYTHGDRFPPMEGCLTFTSHWHSRLTVSEKTGQPRAPELVRVFKELNVNIVHLAEFHGDGHPSDPGPLRLPELEGMFDLCRRYSDDAILLLPGEEANAQLNLPAPKGTPPGHWVYLFPKPVYLTLVRGEGEPFEEEIAPYGRVYHAGSEADMAEILRREKALAWTAHPRIKASYACPDAYREKPWYRSDTWLGGAWKAMPADLSEPRLGVRVLDLLDDMNTWGQRKVAHGEVDCFEIDRTHEMYGHMNVNYLRLEKRPSADDWSPVLDVLRRGDFFVTTGEVLIHSFKVRDGAAVADLEWTLPLRHVELVTSDGRTVKHERRSLAGTAEFGRKTFEWPIDLKDVAWVRLEAWDVAVDGAFTQPLWLK